ncbi:MAG: nucleoside hydrolase [Caldilineaceae bacterium]|nr:nucleoside hydrolase [Caldilineaceae bacterium]
MSAFVSLQNVYRAAHRRSRLWACPRSLAIFLLALAVTLAGGLLPAQSAHAQAPLPIIVDTDAGVDDALALLWLLRQDQRPLQVLGVVSVFGNTDVNNTTNNVLYVLALAGRSDIQVVKGAAAPLVRQPTLTGWFLHGPDGLWGLGAQNPQDQSGVSTDAVGFYCATAAANPGATLLALGPATNIAQAAAACPDSMRTLNIVLLGGAKGGGNKTPVAEANFWSDPDAVQQVLNAGLRPTILPFDAFSTLRTDAKDIDKLLRKSSPTAQMLAPAVLQYVNVQLQFTGVAVLPDLTAAVYAVDPSLGGPVSALIKMMSEDGISRGQSLVALTMAERIALIIDDAEFSQLAIRAFTEPGFDLGAALGEILAREPDNAWFVPAVDNKAVWQAVERGLRN